MRKNKKAVIAAILTATIAISLIGCGSSSNSDENSNSSESSNTSESSSGATSVSASNPAETLVIGTTTLGTESFTFDNANPCTNPIVYETLMRIHYTDEYEAGNEEWGAQPNLAESMESSEDGLTWTIKLRQGVQWQRGYGEFTTADVNYTWNQIMVPDNNAGICYYFTESDPDNGFIESWDIIDEYTMEVHLSRLEALFEYDMADVGVVIRCKKYCEEVGLAGDYADPVGTGPWVFNKEESVSGDCLSFDRYDDYWGTASDFEALQLKLAADSNSALMMLQNGQIDMFQIDAEQVEEASALGYNTLEIENTRNMTLCFGGQFLAGQDNYDPTCPWVSHSDEDEDSEWNTRARLVREAICYAIDRDAIIENIVYGHASRSYLRDFTADMVQCDDSWEFYEYNPDKAKELLAEAGYENGFEQDVIFLVPNVSSYGVNSNAVANACCDYLEAIGIRVKREVMDDSSIYQKWIGDKDCAWSMMVDWAQWVPDPVWAWIWSGTSTAFEYKDFWSKQKDEYVFAAMQTIDEDARYAIETECGTYLLSEYADCALFSANLIYAYNDTISGWSPVSSYEQTINWQMNLNAIKKAN